ncbi:MAG: hypothetical protein RR359_02330 [Bacilli bacterium]
MFYNESRTISDCKEIPSTIFDLIKENHLEMVDKILTKNIVDINTKDEVGYDVLSRLLAKGAYDLVEKHMKNKQWNINNQNIEGNTFAHILVSINYVKVKQIILNLKKNKSFDINIKNYKGETILDKSINSNYIYTTIKILEDTRFNNIDIVSFKHLFEVYIKNNSYGKYSKISNLEIILDNLEDKNLIPSMNKVVINIKDNIKTIKTEILNNNIKTVNDIINNIYKEINE